MPCISRGFYFLAAFLVDFGQSYVHYSIYVYPHHLSGILLFSTSSSKDTALCSSQARPLEMRYGTDEAVETEVTDSLTDGHLSLSSEDVKVYDPGGEKVEELGGVRGSCEVVGRTVDLVWRSGKTASLPKLEGVEGVTISVSLFVPGIGLV
jgi:hypothetical protein